MNIKNTVMKHTIFLFILLLSFSCTSSDEVMQQIIEEEEVVVITPKKVEIVISTSQLDFDEIIVSYYDFDEQDWVFGPRQFTYDSNGNPEPIVILLPEYAHKKIEGETYRRNSLKSSLKVELFINDELVFEEEAVGTDLDYAHVIFDYTIEE